MRMRKIRICLIVVLIIAAGVGIYFYMAYGAKDTRMEGTLVKNVSQCGNKLAERIEKWQMIHFT